MTSHPPLQNSDCGQNIGKDYPLKPIGILRSNRNTSYGRTFCQAIAPQDRHLLHPSQLLNCQVVIGLSGNLSRLSWLRRVLLISPSYDFLSTERLMRTFRGLPLVAAMLDATSSTQATAGTFCSTSTTFMGLRRKTRIKGASI